LSGRLLTNFQCVKRFTAQPLRANCGYFTSTQTLVAALGAAIERQGME
jgi:hypothetical protein